jgi:hypothetical protein
MNYREYLAHRYGFETFADLLDASDSLPPIRGSSAKSYIARHRDGHWFLWEDSPLFSAGVSRESSMPIDQAKINDAIHECVDLCRDKRAGEIFPTIREFMKSLTSAGSWTAEELRAFEGAVNRALIFGLSRGMVYGSASGHGAPQTGVTTA